MRLHRAPWAALPLALALPLACKSDPPETKPAPTATAEAPVTAPSATASAALRVIDRAALRRAGVTGMMFSAAETIDIKDAQRTTIANLSEQIRGMFEGPQAAMRVYQATLAAQVRAGKIDTPKLEALQADADKATQASRDKDAELQNALHAALEPAQRKALVASVRAKLAERPRGEPDGGKPGDAERAKKTLDHLTRTLDLDAAQQKKVAAILPKVEKAAPETTREEANKHGDAVLAAFEGDGFDAKKLTPPTPSPKSSPMAEHRQLIEALVPLLKPEQLPKLAAQEEMRHGDRHVRRPPHTAEGSEPGAPEP